MDICSEVLKRLQNSWFHHFCPMCPTRIMRTIFPPPVPEARGQYDTDMFPGGKKQRLIPIPELQHAWWQPVGQCDNLSETGGENTVITMCFCDYVHFLQRMPRCMTWQELIQNVGINVTARPSGVATYDSASSGQSEWSNSLCVETKVQI